MGMEHTFYRSNTIIQRKDIHHNQNSLARKNEPGDRLLKLSVGQQVTGKVTALGAGIKIMLQEHEITAPREMFPHAFVGASILFEVLSISGSQIELSAAGQNAAQNGKAMEAILRLDADRDVLLSRKEQEGKQTEREEEHKNNMSKIEEYLSKITEKDYQALEKEGFPVEEFTISGLGEAITRHKTSRCFGSDGQEQSRKGGKGQEGARQETEIKRRLKEANLPAAEDIVKKVMSALNLSTSIGKLDEDAMKYLIRSELPPTLENLYKARHSRGHAGKETVLSEEAWSELLPQVEAVIEASGYAINAESLERAKWLVENRLPLTEENFIYYCRLSDMEAFGDQSEVLDRILEDMGKGAAPKDVIVIPGQQERMQKLVEDIGSVSKEEIRDAARTEKEINLKLLLDLRYREECIKEAQDKELTDKQQMEAVRAQRLLEELRLKMTTEAAGSLERRGIHIETQSLERVVEELKELEESYYRSLFKEADFDADADQISILRETTDGLERLKTVPLYVLGTTLSTRRLQTIPGLLKEGNALSVQLTKAREQYESLQTEPNREYGDSIQKAFLHTGSLLKELGMEDTVYNQRAVRILGYNRMEITRENLDQIKAFDLEVNTLMKNLHPAVTVRLIKEGINPLGVPISELNRKIDELRKEQGITAEEKFSTYLRRLEKNAGISEEERKAYIGIYRLLHSIDKTDGAALGAVIKADREVTLSNLLTAVRSIHRGHVDAAVDDNFGFLEGLDGREETITDQLSRVYGEEAASEAAERQEEIAAGKEARAEFMNQEIRQMLSELSPEALHMVWQKLHHGVLPALQASKEMTDILSPGQGIWEDIKDAAVDKLFDLLKSAGNSAKEDQVYEEKLSQFKQIYQNADQAVRFLEDFKVPCTTANIMIAGQILNNSGGFFKKYFQLRDENAEINSQNNLQEIEELADNLIDKDSINMTYEQLGTEAEKLFLKESLSERIDSKRLAELKELGAHMKLMKTLAAKEFYQIPVETQNGITGINLTIIRGTGSTGKVTVSLQSEALGRVKGDISLKDKLLNGYIASDSRRGAELLQENLPSVKEMLKEENITVKQLGVCYDRLVKDTYTYQKQEGEEQQASRNSETERLLYRIARGLVLTIGMAEAKAMADKTAAS